MYYGRCCKAFCKALRRHIRVTSAQPGPLACVSRLSGCHQCRVMFLVRNASERLGLHSAVPHPKCLGMYPDQLEIVRHLARLNAYSPTNTDPHYEEHCGFVGAVAKYVL